MLDILYPRVRVGGLVARLAGYVSTGVRGHDDRVYWLIRDPGDAEAVVEWLERNSLFGVGLLYRVVDRLRVAPLHDVVAILAVYGVASRVENGDAVVRVDRSGSVRGVGPMVMDVLYGYSDSVLAMWIRDLAWRVSRNIKVVGVNGLMLTLDEWCRPEWMDGV